MELPDKATIKENIKNHKKFYVSLEDCSELWSFPTSVTSIRHGKVGLRTVLLSFRGKIVDSFTSFRNNYGDICENELRRRFGERYVGLCGIAESKNDRKQKPKKRISKAKRQRKADGSSSEEEDSNPNKGNIESIWIHALALHKDAKSAREFYLCTWQGFHELDCSWVKDKDMSTEANNWWSREREHVFPDFNDDDFPLYDEKTNTLSLGTATNRFVNALRVELLVWSGIPPAPAGESMASHLAAHVAKPDFPVLSLLHNIVKYTP